ncbi:MAG: hypothetical protein WAK97_21320, partial [Pseudolabrys sp.]
CKAGTRRRITIVIKYGELARLGVQPFRRVEANLDAERDKGTERAMYTSAERDPFLGAFRFGGEWEQQQERGNNNSLHGAKPNLHFQKGPVLISLQEQIDQDVRFVPQPDICVVMG